MAYSEDFRKKVFEVKEKYNLSLAEVAARFGVGVASVSRWTKQPAPKKTRNKPATRIDNQKLAEDVKNHPDSYQHERAARLGVSKAGISAALKRLGIQRKKSVKPENRRTTAKLRSVKNAGEAKAGKDMVANNSLRN